jgi:hypothetical protein
LKRRASTVMQAIFVSKLCSIVDLLLALFIFSDNLIISYVESSQLFLENFYLFGMFLNVFEDSLFFNEHGLSLDFTIFQGNLTTEVLLDSYDFVTELRDRRY